MTDKAIESWRVLRGVVCDLVTQEMERLSLRITSKRRIGLGGSDEYEAETRAYARLRQWHQREQEKGRIE